MMISVQRKSLLNLNISPFAFRRELLLEELEESRTRDNTLRFNNLQFTNHNTHYTSIVRQFRKNRTFIQVFLWLRRLLNGVVSNKQAISVQIWRSVRDMKCRGPVTAVAMYSGVYTLLRAGSVVGIATPYGLDDPGIESLWRRYFPHLSRPALRPIQPPV
jgi:hypothetical protein